MSGDFHDANYNVTKIRTADGEVAELELNGKSVALASDVKIQGSITGPAQCRQQHGGKNGDDGDNDQ